MRTYLTFSTSSERLAEHLNHYGKEGYQLHSIHIQGGHVVSLMCKEETPTQEDGL